MRIDLATGLVYFAQTIERVLNMTYQVLARKWRPKVFEDVIGQEHVNRTLRNSVLKKQVAHAYLLTGTRGVGKTTIARIFAKAIRCENLTEEGNPCLVCSSCLSIDQNSSLDYIEIDGASNTGVDNIRDLIDNVQYLPSSGKFKVYVIDEVHMLSVNAFNALLKTLEEPPEHVVFIFATTDPHKLLGTVLSRVQRFDFKNVSIETLVAHVKHIAKAEKINFTSDSLISELAKHGKGSVRDTLSLLDQVLSLSIDRNIDEDILLMSLGLAKTQSLKLLLNGIMSGNKAECIQAYNFVLDENVDLEKFVLQVLDSLFTVIENIDSLDNVSELIVNKSSLEGVSTAELLWIYEVMAKDFEWAVKSLDPVKMILFTLIKVALRDEIINGSTEKVEIKKKVIIEEIVVPEVQEEVQEVKIEVEIEPEVIKEEILVEEKEEIKVEKNWDNFLKFAMEHQQTIGTNLERGNILGDINLNNEELSIELGISEEDKIFYEFLNDPDARNTVTDLLATFFEMPTVRFRLNLLNADEKEKKQFLSVADIGEKNLLDLKDERRKELLENKHVKEAEMLFNSKIDKVILNEE